MKILFLEDDPVIADIVRDFLGESYEVQHCFDSETALQYAEDEDFALYIFDINVPEIDGFDLLESLRNASDKTPTIFMSAMVDINSISKGFELGAEDYLKKPFFPEELLIRVKAKLTVKEELFTCGDFTYDEKNNEFTKAGHRLSLGEVQQALFDQFYHNIGRTIDKDILLECLTQPSSTALRVAINKLKQTTGLPIENVRGVGYVLEAC